MDIWKRNLWLCWLTLVLSLAGSALALPFLPLYIKEHFGVADENLCGFYVALLCFGEQLCFAVAAPIWGYLADRYGRKLMLLRASFIGGITFPLMIVAPNVAALIGVRMLSSCFTGTVNAAQMLVAAGTPEKHQGMALGTLSSAVWSGNMLGFFVGGMVVEHWGYYVAFALCGVHAVLAGVVACFIHEDFIPPARVAVAARPKKRRHLPQFSAAVWVLLSCFVLLGLLRYFEIPYVALKVEQIAPAGRAAGYTGIISGLVALAGVISGIMLGRLADRFPARIILWPTLIVTGLMNILQGVTTSVWLLGSSRFAAYLSGGGLEPVLQRLMSRKTPVQQRGSAFGWAGSARQCGCMLSAVITGAIVFHWGVVSVFVISGVLFLVLMVPLIRVISAIEENRFGRNFKRI